MLIPGAKAPKLIRKEDLKTMQPGAVIVDEERDRAVHEEVAERDQGHAKEQCNQCSPEQLPVIHPPSLPGGVGDATDSIAGRWP